MARKAREDIREAIQDIEEDPNLTKADKARIVKRYAALAEQLEEQEEYAARSRRSLITMSLLGVVAGFMTHECDTMLHDLQRANDHLKRLARKDDAVREVQEDFERRLTSFQGYVSYSRLFVWKAGSDEVDSFAASGQVRYVIKHFSSFADDRGITVTNEVPRDLKAPLVPVTAYSGILRQPAYERSESHNRC